MTEASTNDDIKGQLRRITQRLQHVEDVLAIQKLQSKYVHYLFTQRYDRMVDECFAKHADVAFEFSDSGVFRGLERIRAVFEDLQRAKEAVPGFFILHMTVNPYIEIAQDGRSARSHWLSPGAVASNYDARWVWGPFYVNYVKEGDEWRIVYSNLAPVFRNRFEESWVQASEHGTVHASLTQEPNSPPTIYRPYNELKREANMFRNHPDLPQRY